MIVSLSEMKNYLRVDTDTEDRLIFSLLQTSERLCQDIIRGSASKLETASTSKVAVMYAVAYLYEHREEADYKGLLITLRSLLYADRRYSF